MNSTLETTTLGGAGHLQVPTRWRVGQAILCVIVALLGIYYFTLG